VTHLRAGVPTRPAELMQINITLTCCDPMDRITEKKGETMAKATKASLKSAKREEMGNKEYAKEMKKLHIELVKMQEWVKHAGLKVCIVFEGRDTAGKGGTIKAITERVSPRTFRVVALPAPTEREKSQMYVQRYLPHFPAAGEVVIFDRSWYNRAGVERVMGFVDEKIVTKFLEMVPKFEKVMVDSGIILIKYWLEVSADEQTKRLSARIDDGRKTWKLSPMDLKSYSKWFDYSRARDDMFKYTHSEWAPWIVADSNDKKRARLNIISDLLSRVPYKSAPRERIKLPKRQKDTKYKEPRHNVVRVKEKY
jgi:polyphosphate kinase 2